MEHSQIGKMLFLIVISATSNNPNLTLLQPVSMRYNTWTTEMRTFNVFL